MRDPQVGKSSFITIGKIFRAHGVRGTVRVFPTTDQPERFRGMEQLRIQFRDGSIEQFSVENINIRHRDILLKLESISDRDAAERLCGCQIVITKDECLPLPEGSYYIFDLIGSNVLAESGEEIGVLEEVWEFPANDIYVVRKGKQEILIPAVHEFVLNVDIENKTILIKLIDGLLPE